MLAFRLYLLFIVLYTAVLTCCVCALCILMCVHVTDLGIGSIVLTELAESVQEDIGDLELESWFGRKECATHIIFKLWFLNQDLHIPGTLPIVQTTVI